MSLLINEERIVERLVGEWIKNGSIDIVYVHDEEAAETYDPKVRDLLRECKAIGARVIAYSADEEAAALAEQLKIKNIPFDEINEPFFSAVYNNRKQRYDILLDERAGLPSAFEYLEKASMAMRSMQSGHSNIESFKDKITYHRLNESELEKPALAWLLSKIFEQENSLSDRFQIKASIHRIAEDNGAVKKAVKLDAEAVGTAFSLGFAIISFEKEYDFPLNIRYSKEGNIKYVSCCEPESFERELRTILQAQNETFKRIAEKFAHAKTG